ncbi:hypothetical protein AB0B78_33920 [Streptomyces sp. NPDC040724]|uniref:hypothetical protein n=1 Tax=Streptomyces sp. NPDC040724 TaxID=3155612 RepID=UPI0033CE8F04
MNAILKELVGSVPPDPQADLPDWPYRIEQLGLVLPDDYLALMKVYGPGKFDDFLLLLCPGAEPRAFDLLWRRSRALDDLRQRAADGEEFGHSVAPGSEELLPWAVTDNGDTLYWVTAHPDPNKWSIALNEGRGPEWNDYHGTATEFLAAVFARRTHPAILPDDFPSDHPEFASLANLL